ncbi:hypothetical protein FACS1894156_9200 [Bacteroidia bacterium]|nr:hypothetical protein FACS1894156_9200 [Bacteroidia bacterium]
MVNSLSTLDSKSIKDLQVVSDSVKQYMDTGNDAMLQMAFDRVSDKPTLAQRLFPDKLHKEHNRMLVATMQSVFEKKKAVFELQTNVQLELVRQQGDALISGTGMQFQEQLASFATAKMDTLTNTLHSSKDSYITKMEVQWANAENIKNPILKNHYEMSLNSEMDAYFGFVDDLINGFKDAMNRKIADLKR